MRTDDKFQIRSDEDIEFAHYGSPNVRSSNRLGELGELAKRKRWVGSVWPVVRCSGSRAFLGLSSSRSQSSEVTPPATQIAASPRAELGPLAGSQGNACPGAELQEMKTEMTKAF